MRSRATAGRDSISDHAGRILSIHAATAIREGGGVMAEVASRQQIQAAAAYEELLVPAASERDHRPLRPRSWDDHQNIAARTVNTGGEQVSRLRSDPGLVESDFLTQAASLVVFRNAYSIGVSTPRLRRRAIDSLRRGVCPNWCNSGVNRSPSRVPSSDGGGPSPSWRLGSRLYAPNGIRTRAATLKV